MVAVKRIAGSPFMATKTPAYFNNFFWLFLTCLSAPCLYFLIFLRGTLRRGSGQEKNTPLKILVIQTAKIGDLVCATPVFREIKKKLPDSHLTVLITVKTKDILKNNPRVDEIILVDDYPGILGKIKLLRKLRKGKYDWAFNLLPGSFNNIIAFWSLVPNRVATCYKGAGEIMDLLSVFNNYRLEYKRHTCLIGHYLNLLKVLGIEQASEEKEMFVRPEEERKASNFLVQNSLSTDDLLIGISAVPGNKIKQWDLSKFAALSDLLIERVKVKIIFTGSADDRSGVEKIQKMMRNRSINAAGYFKLHELSALLRLLKLFISVDSGPLYIANALGVPVIDIGGCYDIREQSPSGGKYKILQKNNNPLPDYSVIVSSDSNCTKWFSGQLQEITPEEVLEAAFELITAR